MDFTRLLALDGRGILPEQYEKPDAYLARGDRMLAWYDHPARRAELIAGAVTNFRNSNPACRNVSGVPRCRQSDAFRRGVARFGAATGADLSWVVIIGFHHSEYDGKGFATLVGQSASITTSQETPLPYLAVNTQWGPPFLSQNFNGAHEAFHLIQSPFYDTELDYGDAEPYSHLGDRFIRPVRRLVVFNAAERVMRTSWWQLYRSFGAQAGYVQARMSYDELAENVVTPFKGKSPAEFLRWAASSDHNLRFKIIAHRLGL